MSVTIDVTSTKVIEVGDSSSEVTIEQIVNEIVIEGSTSVVEVATTQVEIIVSPIVNEVVIDTGGGGIGGATTFDELDDTPGSKVGQDGKAVVVDEATNELKYVTLPGGTSYAFDDLSDTPANKTGSALKGVAVNAGATDLEYVDFVLDTAFQLHALNTANPHSVTASQSGADTIGSAAAVQANLDTHEADTANPHAVTAAQAGADAVGSADDVQDNLDTHEVDLANPHEVTQAQVGALENQEYITGKTTGAVVENLIGIDGSDKTVVGNESTDMLLIGSVTRPAYKSLLSSSDIALLSDVNAHANNTSNPHHTTFDLLDDVTSPKLAYSRQGVTVNNGGTALIYEWVIKADGSIELTADWDCGSFGIKVPYVDFDISYSDSVVEGRQQWNSDDGTLEVGLPGGNVVGQLLQELLVRVKNTSGAQIDNGSVVVLAGATGHRPEVGLADASDVALSGAIALATEDIASSQLGYSNIGVGIVRDVDTSKWTSTTPLYLSATTPGALTDTIPDAPNTNAQVGFVIYQHATEGSIYFFPNIKPRLTELSDVTHTEGSVGDLLVVESSDVKAYQTPAEIGIISTVSTKTANYTMTAAPETVLADTSGGAFTVKLPAADVSIGRVCTVTKIASSTNAVTFSGNRGELIAGVASWDITGQWDSMSVESNGTYWVFK